MGTVLKTLTVNVTADTHKLVKGFAGMRKTVAGTVAKLAALGGGILGVKAAFEAAAVQDKAVARLDAVIKSTGQSAGFTSQQIQGMAADLQKVTTFGDEATISAAAMLATFKQIKGDNFRDALAAAQDMSTVMGSDLQGSVVQLGKALNDPIIGLTALTRSGVTFSAEQQKLIKSLASTNQKAKAQRIILDELASQFGGAAASEAKTFSGQLTQMKNALGDLSEIFAQRMQPALSIVTTNIKSLSVALSDPQTFDSILKWGKLAAGFVAAVYITPKVIAAFGFITKAVTAMGKATATANAIGQAFTGPSGWLKLAIGAGVAVGASWGIDALFSSTAVAAEDSAQALKLNEAQLSSIAITEDKTADAGQKLVDNLQEQIATFGMSSREASIFKAQNEGATDAMLKQARALDQQMSGLEAAKQATEDFNQKQQEMATKAKSITDSLKTPAKAFKDEIRSMLELVEAGALGWDDYRAAVSKSITEQVKSSNISAPESLSKAERGSAGAFQQVAEIRGQERLKQIQEEQLKVQREIVAAIEKQEQVQAPGNTNIVNF